MRHWTKSLPQKAREKVAYNISKSMVITDNELFKNWKAPRFGSSVPYTMVSNTGFWLFGTQNKKRW